MKAKIIKDNNKGLNEALEEVSREEEKLLTTRISVSLHKRLKERAVKEGRSIKEIIIELLESYLVIKI